MSISMTIHVVYGNPMIYIVIILMSILLMTTSKFILTFTITLLSFSHLIYNRFILNDTIAKVNMCVICIVPAPLALVA